MHLDLTLRLTGTAPLLMRAGRLADPLDDHAVALHRFTSKRLKSIADHEAIARIEWRGSLWLAGGRPCVPAEAIEAAMVAGGKTCRCGSLVRSAVMVRQSPLLEYAGATDLDDLYLDKAFVHRSSVRIGTRTTMRTRPLFQPWSLTTTLSYLPSTIDGTTLLEIAGLAGEMIGIGDFRPKFGRFRVEVVG